MSTEITYWKLRIAVINWADLPLGIGLYMIDPYLKDVWELSDWLVYLILFLLVVIALIMSCFLRCFLGPVLGYHGIHFLARFAFLAGLTLLTMSTPPVLSGAFGNCSEYKPECIGQGQRNLFYTALALIVLGMSGYIVTAFEFLYGVNSSAYDLENGPPCTCVFNCLVLILVPTIALIAIPLINPWSIKFCITAIGYGIVSLIYLGASCCYFCQEAHRGALTYSRLV